MTRFFGILLLNGWRGFHRGSREIAPAALAVLASVAALLVTSSVATASPDSSLKTQATMSNHTSTAQSQPMVVLSLFTTGQGSTNPKHGVKSAKNFAAKMRGDAVKPDATSRVNNTGQLAGGTGGVSQKTAPATNPNSVQLSQMQTVCEQGQPTYTVSSAQLTLPAPTSAAGTLSWYWETRIDAGTNASGTSPISNAQNSQTIAADTSVVALTGASSSQPLLSALGYANFAYSFRLHVVGPVDITSAWVSVPQDGSC